MSRHEQVLALQAEKKVPDVHSLQIRLSKDVIKELEEECRALRIFFQDRRMPPRPPTIAGMKIIEVEGENIMEIV